VRESSFLGNLEIQKEDSQKQKEEIKKEKEQQKQDPKVK
jgi:hypothetical protein